LKGRHTNRALHLSTIVSGIGLAPVRQPPEKAMSATRPFLTIPDLSQAYIVLETLIATEPANWAAGHADHIDRFILDIEVFSKGDTVPSDALEMARAMLKLGHPSLRSNVFNGFSCSTPCFGRDEFSVGVNTGFAEIASTWMHHLAFHSKRLWLVAPACPGCEFPAYRSHFVSGVMAPPDFRRKGATAFSA
jgi:hypothetical protein